MISHWEMPKSDVLIIVYSTHMSSIHLQRTCWDVIEEVRDLTIPFPSSCFLLWRACEDDPWNGWGERGGEERTVLASSICCRYWMRGRGNSEVEPPGR